MAKKSKGFDELLKRQRTYKAEQETLEKLHKKIRQSPLSAVVPELVTTPKGGVKMSEVLKAFVAPYLDHAKNPNQRKGLFTLAVLAWNLALIPENDRQPMIDQMIEQGLKLSAPLIQQDMRGLIDELIVRKQQFFADNQYYILSYELQETGKECQIAVASTLMNQSTAE